MTRLVTEVCRASNITFAYMASVTAREVDWKCGPGLSTAILSTAVSCTLVSSNPVSMLKYKNNVFTCLPNN